MDSTTAGMSDAGNLLSLTWPPPQPILIVAFFFASGWLAFLYRSIVEEEPDSFVLSMTLFTGISQIGLWVQAAVNEQTVGFLFVLLSVLALVLMLIAVGIHRVHVRLTRHHIRDVLRDRAKFDLDDAKERAQLESWADICATLSGVDFWPELWGSILASRKNGSTYVGARADRRELALRAIPGTLFDRNNLHADDLLVPADRRRKPWRSLVAVFWTAWTLHVVAALTLASGL